MAEVIINWQAEKLRIGLHKNWDQARQNRAAEQAMAQVWTAKPLPFAGRVHADPDYHQATLLQNTDPELIDKTSFSGPARLQSHHELHQLNEIDSKVDNQTDVLPKSNPTEKKQMNA